MTNNSPLIAVPVVRRWLVLIALLLLAACATPAPAPVLAAAEVEQALQNFSRLMLAGDHAAAAALYADDGEISHAGSTPVRGAAAIRSFMAGFKSYRVREYRLVADSTTAGSQQARQAGSYFQRVALADGSTVEATGRFEADWARDASGNWRILRMATRAAP